ncbi:MAG: hypothetical protein Q7U28_19290 [Aquabacterium sp.]|nr:hypothetical protein [Aquabacterium sp.]
MMKNTVTRLRSARQIQSGFSLLETVGVVAIASTLTASALPHFAQLPTEARVAVVKTMESAVFTASRMAHMACAVRSTCSMSSGSSAVVASGSEIHLYRGYPQGGDVAGIENALDYSGFTAVRLDGRTVFQKNGAPDAAACAVSYAQPSDDGASPVIEALTTGC